MASIRKRNRADGTTVYAVLWRDEAGQQRSLTFDNAGTADQALRLLAATHADPYQIAALLTATTRTRRSLAEAVEVHITELTGVYASTRHKYRQIARDYITPKLGEMPVEVVDKTSVARWLNDLERATTKGGALVSDKTIKNVHGLLSGVMATAIDKGWSPGPNPCRGMRLPRRGYGDEEMVCLTPDQWRRLAGEITPHWRPMFRFLAATGVRWGEAVGLTVGHLELRADIPCVRINQADRREPTGRELGPTKTRRGRRRVSLPASAVEMLAPLVEGRVRSERLFLSPRGLPAHSGLYHRVWMPAVARAQDATRHGDHALGVSPRIHDLRHSHASWLIAAGIDLLTVSRRLGHESIQTTASVYGHLLPDQMQRAAAAAEAAYAYLTGE